MKLGIIIHGNESETVWNAFRLGIFSLDQKDIVKAFLLGKGVECDQLDQKNLKSLSKCNLLSIKVAISLLVVPVCKLGNLKD